MQRSDTHLLRLKEVKAFLRALDRAIPAPGTEITLIGGAAVALLCADEERQTDDIDTLGLVHPSRDGGPQRARGVLHRAVT